MPLPVLLAATYLVVNFALTVWLAREEAHARLVPEWVLAGSAVLRYGPPFIGLLYLVTRAGDWPFVLFVAAFFTMAAWLLNGLLSYPTRPRK